MIQRAVTAIIGVVIGLFATFAVFGTILGGLDNFFLLTQNTCNYGDSNSPDRILRGALVTDRTDTPNDVDWGSSIAGTFAQHGSNVTRCTFDVAWNPGTHPYMVTPTGDYIQLGRAPGATSTTAYTVGDTLYTNPETTWLDAEGVFTAQRQLVVLLAVIAAIGMPLGAMTAVVFFGQAVVSSGVEGSGASQVLVAIAAVVIILVAVQMFQQFAGYLGDAFDAVDGDRFVVFNETLGSLAETIAEFWGVLAFAGLINIATIVWRNYNGNMSMGGLGEGSGGRSL